MSNVLEKIINQKKNDLIVFKKKYTKDIISKLTKQNKSYINFKKRILYMSTD